MTPGRIVNLSISTIGSGDGKRYRSSTYEITLSVAKPRAYLISLIPESLLLEKWLYNCKDPRYRSLQLHLGQKTTMLGPHVRASDSSIYKVLTVRSSQ